MRLSKNEAKYLRSLSQKKVRQAERKFLLEGWRALKDGLNSSFVIESVNVLPRFLEDNDYQGILNAVRERHVPIKELSEIELRQISETVHAQGVIAVVRKKDQELSERLLKQSEVIVAADAVSDPGNIGTLVRTSDWFGADLVMLGNGCVELYNEKVVRSTVGSLLHLPIVENVDLPAELAQLKRSGFRITALSGDGKTEYQNTEWGRRNVIVLGSEAHGVSKETMSVADSVVRIPKFGRAESLNIGVACGIVLAHLKSTIKKS
ncbi:MAG TPA: RNA methyltransferase [Bacteroidota bacterium]|nr:RNA methyltransferase [Bacteroidota bacterium]